MRAKDYFFNWLILVYGAYLFFSKGLAYSFVHYQRAMPL